MRFEIIIDKTERLGKCTILPLEDRPDFNVRRLPKEQAVPPLTGDLLLHPDGEPLDKIADSLGSVRVLSSVDCNWRRLATILGRVQGPLPRLVRIPDGFCTAYPRRNKQNRDPDGGLATIEALFIAAAFCGRWDESLLGQYHFASQFLALNSGTFSRYRLGG